MSIKSILALALSLAFVGGCQAQTHSPAPITIQDHSQEEVYQAQLDSEGQVVKSNAQPMEDQQDDSANTSKDQVKEKQATAGERKSKRPAQKIQDSRPVKEKRYDVAAEKDRQPSPADSKQAAVEEIQADPPADSTQLQDDSTAQALDGLVAKLGMVNPAAYDFIVLDESADRLRVEVRQSQAQADEEISNLLGIFNYQPSTGHIQKLNAVTGEFEDYE